MTTQIINDRYELLEKLGEGGMAIVYRALDRQENVEVALKAMKVRAEMNTLKLFAREFQTIASLDHPYCLRVFDYGDAQQFPFFTMELFSGEPITSVCSQPRQFTLKALFQAVSAVEFVHSKGIVHRDITPSNFLLRIQRSSGTDSPTVEVKLADFGLARFANLASSIGTTSGFVGTVQYCAPEQLETGLVDYRADYYALGLVCYEVLSGRYPFDDALRAGVESVLHAKLTLDLPPISHPTIDWPQEIKELVLELLAKAPADRPESLASLREALATESASESNPGAGTGEPATDLLDWGRPIFVGRSPELDSARHLLQVSLAPHSISKSQWSKEPIPSVLFVTGEAGIGKSAFLGEVRNLAARQGASVYDGRCFEGNLAPYQPFVEILRQVLVESRRQVESITNIPSGVPPVHPGAVPAFPSTPVADSLTPNLRSAALRRLIEEYESEILRIAPDLGKWLDGEAFEQVDLSRESHYVLRAVAGLFVQMSTIRSTCLLIEDLQWADEGTLDLLRHLVAGAFRDRELSIESNANCPRLFICCSVRDGYRHAREYMSVLSQEHQADVLELGPFSEDEVKQLSSTLLGGGDHPLTDSLADPLIGRCRGNPLFVEHTIRNWQTKGWLVREAKTWSLSPSAAELMTWPESVREVLRTRKQGLSASALEFLGAGSVIGPVIDIDVAKEVCDTTTSRELLEAIEEILDAKILIEVGDKPNLEFSHDLLRELTYQDLSASRRHFLHEQIATVLESRRDRGHDVSSDALAVHYSKAGNPAKAFEFLVEAGEGALRAYAANDAIGYFSRANEFRSTMPGDEIHYMLNDLLAEAHTAAGHPHEAIEFYERNLQLTSDSHVRGQIKDRIGRHHFRIGNFDSAAKSFDDALAYLGRRTPRSSAGTIGTIAIDLLSRPFSKTLRKISRSREDQHNRTVSACTVYDDMTYLWLQRSILMPLYTNLRQLVLAERLNDPTMLANAYGIQSLFFALFSLDRLALHVGNRALAWASKSDERTALAVAEGILGCVHYVGARHDEAERLLSRSLAVLDRCGDSWFRMFFYHQMRHLCSIRGDGPRELVYAAIELEISETVKDREGTYYALYGKANALGRMGNLNEALETIELAVSKIFQPNMMAIPTALHTYGFIYMQLGDYDAAVGKLEESREALETSLGFVDYGIRVYPLLVECLLGPNWYNESKPPEIGRALKMSRRGMFWCNRFPNYRPHMLRTRGRLEFARGNAPKAIRQFRRSIDAAESIGARYDLARAYIDLAVVDGDSSTEYRAKGLQILEEINAVLPVAEIE